MSSSQNEGKASRTTQGSDDSGQRRNRRVLEQGERVGRYLVLRELGSGGMGAVYAAYDPELDRKVALKLVRFVDERSEMNRARLLREAQAMARVTHPNVVTVHDVGTWHDEIYVAMEFIEGGTLKAWRKAKTRSWRDIIEVFTAAGRGLAAAHDQGLIHRDFKPENVMVADSNRVVVMDFGLARGREPESAEAAPPSGSQLLLSTELTRAGALPGTPAYMSPEQFAGVELDARSDQFSFCVALYETLYGERPFAGDTMATLAFAVSQGRIVAPRPDREVPASLRRVVLKGLAARPADRWPSMRALLDAMAVDRSNARRTWRFAAAATVLAGASLGMGLWIAQRGNVCGGTPQKLSGIWDDERRREITARVDTLDLAWFEKSWESTAARLDAYAREWAAGHQDACEATNVRREQSEHVMDLRMGCLERARVELEATTNALATMTAEDAAQSHQMLDGLPTLSSCTDTSRLLAEGPLPEPAAQESVAELRRRLAAARAELGLGRFDSAVESLRTLEPVALEIGYPPLLAEHALLLGQAELAVDRVDAAQEHLTEAVRTALATDQFELAIEGLNVLTNLSAIVRRQPKTAMVYATMTDALASRPGLGPKWARLGPQSLAEAHDAAGDYDAALLSFRAALDLTPENLPLERARTQSGLAAALESRGRLDEAKTMILEVRDVHLRLLGEKHPQLADDFNMLGNLAMQMGNFAEAEAAHREALELTKAARAADHPSLAMSHMNLGIVLALAKRHAESDAELRAALAIVGDDHPRAPLIHGNLGTSALYQGKPEVAERENRIALELFADTLGVDHTETAPVHSTLGAALDAQGRHEEAEAEHRTAVAISLAAYGSEHIRSVAARVRLGQNLLAQGRPAEAIEPLEAALLADDPTAEKRFAMRFALARALWETERDRSRALDLAREASKIRHRDIPDKDVAELRAWLAAREA